MDEEDEEDRLFASTASPWTQNLVSTGPKEARYLVHVLRSTITAVHFKSVDNSSSSSSSIMTSSKTAVLRKHNLLPRPPSDLAEFEPQPPKPSRPTRIADNKVTLRTAYNRRHNLVPRAPAASAAPAVPTPAPAPAPVHATPGQSYICCCCYTSQSHICCYTS